MARRPPASRGPWAVTSPAAATCHLFLVFWAPGNSPEFISSSGQGQGPRNAGSECSKGSIERRGTGQLLGHQGSQKTYPGDLSLRLENRDTFYLACKSIWNG